MLVVIAALVAIVAIQFASTASSTPTRQSVSLPKRVAKLEKQMKAVTRAVNGLGSVLGVCMFNKNAPPIPVTRYPAATLPSGGYFDITATGQQAAAYVFEVGDPQCLQLVGFAKHPTVGYLRAQFKAAHIR
jgi:hypothetical protein